MPYIYTYAYRAHATGIPMARPMFLEDQNNSTAWQKELQYFWGKELLVAPNCSDGDNNVSIWLPKGNWYDFWNDKKYAGDQTISYSAAKGVVPVFAKEGAIIPMAPFAKSTLFIPKDTLLVHVYTGSDGSFQLYEDDGVTEKFRTKNEFRLIDIQFIQKNLCLEIKASNGAFTGAPSRRSHQIIYHGLSAAAALYCDTAAIPSYNRISDIPSNQNGSIWDSEKKLQNVHLSSRDINTAFKVANAKTRFLGGGAIKPIAQAVRISQDKIIIDFSYTGDLSISIHQLNGCRVLSFAKPSRPAGSCQAFPLRLFTLSRGIYILRIKTENAELIRHIVLR